MYPSACAAIGDQARVLQRSEMEGQQGLAGVERLREVADAAFTAGELREDPDAFLVAERFQALEGQVQVDRGGYCHAPVIHK